MATPRTGPVVALAGVSAAAGLTLARVFNDGSFVGPVLGAVVAAHALSALGRWRNWSPAANEFAALIGLWLYLAWAIEPSTTAYGIPTGATFHALTTDLSNGFAQLRVAVAPTAVTPGLMVLCAGGMFVCAHLADWAATRLDSTLQAIVPPFVFFVVASALGVSRLRVVTTAAFLLMALLFVLAQSTALQSAGTAWAASVRRQQGPLWLVASGLPTVVLVVVLGLILGPAVPGADANPLLKWKGLGARGDLSRQTISPLVDIKPRLTHNPIIELFRVKADEAHNWRITALDEFDGRTWTSVGSYRSAKGTLFKERDDRAPTVTVHQEYDILGLESFWLPAAYRPTRVKLKGARVHDESLTLLTDHDSAQGLHYSVDSAVPAPTAAQLETGTLTLGFDRFTKLPADFPTAVRALAQRITRGARTPYDEARMLQDYLRTNFKYNENVRPGHSESALLTFLFQTRQGYCEQFAGAFAAMARSLGLPARVAVGFTPGDFDGLEYHVKTNNAHAWPEVHLAGFGWVPFEPTPGRFEMTSSNFTGTFQPPAPRPTTPTTAAAPTTTSPANATPTTRPLDANAPDTGAGATKHRSALVRWLLRMVDAVVLVVVLFGAYAAAVVAMKNTRRRRRSRGQPAERIAGAWAEALERLDEARVQLPDSATPLELARRAGRDRAGVATPMDDLARLQTAATFAPVQPEAHHADAAWMAAGGVAAALDRDDTLPGRLRRKLDPGVRRWRERTRDRELVR